MSEVTELSPTEIFVFGSNLLGRHSGGAARQASEQFGAQFGVGEGLTGHCYAFPTLNESMQKFNKDELLSIKQAFYRCVRAHPTETFLLTPVGTGIAGYSLEEITELFGDLPTNVKKVGWSN